MQEFREFRDLPADVAYLIWKQASRQFFKSSTPVCQLSAMRDSIVQDRFYVHVDEFDSAKRNCAIPKVCQAARAAFNIIASTIEPVYFLDIVTNFCSAYDTARPSRSREVMYAAGSSHRIPRTFMTTKASAIMLSGLDTLFRMDHHAHCIRSLFPVTPDTVLIHLDKHPWLVTEYDGGDSNRERIRSIIHDFPTWIVFDGRRMVTPMALDWDHPHNQPGPPINDNMCQWEYFPLLALDCWLTSIASQERGEALTYQWPNPARRFTVSLTGAEVIEELFTRLPGVQVVSIVVLRGPGGIFG
ncbi:hypothetical protein F4778DRAFT_778033 [Xylariomycetidae sp. FL2044]|nr:hypothetical protein F4778DRAFT_778033 [Xylariomycetidae sp. FL2044]